MKLFYLDPQKLDSSISYVAQPQEAIEEFDSILDKNFLLNIPEMINYLSSKYSFYEKDFISIFSKCDLVIDDIIKYSIPKSFTISKDAYLIIVADLIRESYSFALNKQISYLNNKLSCSNNSLESDYLVLDNPLNGFSYRSVKIIPANLWSKNLLENIVESD